MPQMRLLERLMGRLGEATSLAFVLIVAISAYEVVMRYVFDAPTIWVHEISVALAAAAFAIGGPYVHGTRQHIAITFFFERVPQPARRWVRALQSVLTLVFVGLLTYAAGGQALQSLREGETSGTALNLPIPVTLKTVFALCCVALLVQTAAQLIADVRAAHSRP